MHEAERTYVRLLIKTRKQYETYTSRTKQPTTPDTKRVNPTPISFAHEIDRYVHAPEASKYAEGTTNARLEARPGTPSSLEALKNVRTLS